MPASSHSVPVKSINAVISRLNSMDDEELWSFWKRYHRPTRKSAYALLDSVDKGYTLVARDLANYASNRATSIQCSKRGDRAGESMYAGIAKMIVSSLHSAHR